MKGATNNIRDARSILAQVDRQLINCTGGQGEDLTLEALCNLLLEAHNAIRKELAFRSAQSTLFRNEKGA